MLREAGIRGRGELEGQQTEDLRNRDGRRRNMTAIDFQTPDVNGAAAPPSFVPGPNLDDEAHVDQETTRPESDDGIYFDRLADGAVLELETRHHRYTLVKRASGQALISGHPDLCPEPILVGILGSTGRASILKVGFIGRGRHLMFNHPAHRTAIGTSRILHLRQVR